MYESFDILMSMSMCVRVYLYINVDEHINEHVLLRSMGMLVSIIMSMLMRISMRIIMSMSMRILISL